MKNKFILTFILIFTLFVSCKKSEGNEEIRLIVTHYQATATGVGAHLVYLTQTGTEIGSDNWGNFYDQIEGFSYEPGYIYDLAVNVETIPNPLADGSSASYNLKTINSKTKVAALTQFEIFLRRAQLNFISGNTNTGFKILGKIKIDCETMCHDLDLANASNSTEIIGKFIHNSDGSYLLKELKIK